MVNDLNNKIEEPKSSTFNSGKYIVFNIPGEPMGKGRPRFSTFNGYVRTHTPKETTTYENKVIMSYRQEHEEMVFANNEMIHAEIDAYFIIPKSRYRFHKKTGTTDLDKLGLEMLENKVRPTKKPDCDNIAKIVLDALNGIAYYDDSQVVSLVVRKHYAETTHVKVMLCSADMIGEN